jgi:hypothetical protein
MLTTYIAPGPLAGRRERLRLVGNFIVYVFVKILEQ